MLHAVIMAGGSGTRFWPLSRKKLPKQFLKLFGDRSLIQQAFDRIAGIVGRERVWVVANREQLEQTRQQLPEIPTDQLVGEPCGRDTAACIGLAAALLLRADPEAIMIVLAADHLIKPMEKFHAAVNQAAEYVRANPSALVTFGIRPTRPATGYGYLRRDPGKKSVNGVVPLRSFHEKPTLETAQRYLEDGSFFWNSGIFCWRARTILDEIERHAPAVASAANAIASAWGTPRQDAVFEDEYAKLTRISIDYAVMERSSTVAMVEADFEWDDVGSWLALERVLEADDAGHVLIGSHLGVNSSRCVVVGDDGHLVCTLGVEDLIVVRTQDVTLVANRKDEQSVKLLIAKLETIGRVDLL